MESKEKRPVTAMSVSMRTEIVSFGRGYYRGRLYGQYLETPYEFFTLVRMLEKMESVFDAKKFPQAFLAPRYFREHKKAGPTKAEAKQSSFLSGPIDMSHYEGPGHGTCTFDILVRFRRNATWQGQILWVERNLTQHFRSELEMLRLIDEALIEFESDSEQVAWEGAMSV